MFPVSFFRNSKLDELDSSGNMIELMPNRFNQTPDLTKLNISHNKIDEIPSSIFKLGQLTYLNASHNQISTLPMEINLPRLKCLEIGDNPVGDNRNYIERLFRECPSLEIVILTHELITRNKDFNETNNLVYTPMNQSREPSPSYLSDNEEENDDQNKDKENKKSWG